MSDRGVSEVVGFTLMFSIIILSVAVVSVTGISQLSELSDREQINSAERAMEAFSGSVDDLTRHGDIVRRATLSPSGGLIWLNGSTTLPNAPRLRVRVIENVSGTSRAPFPDTIVVNALEHRFSRNPEAVSIAYESGAVMRSDGGTVVRPQWRCSDDTAVLTAVRLTPGDGLSHGSGFGSSTGDAMPPSGGELPQGDIESSDSGVTFGMERTGTTVYTYDDTQFDLGVDPSNTANADQWRFYFDRRDEWKGPNGGFYECRDVGTVVVREVTVEISR